MELVTAAEMRELDRAAIETRNIPSLRLMENAGKAVVEEMERFFGPLRGKAVTIVAGKGQNGGGGLATAPRLPEADRRRRSALGAGRRPRRRPGDGHHGHAHGDVGPSQARTLPGRRS